VANADGGPVCTRDILEDAWNGSIENSGVRGKYKRALKIWGEHDVEMTVDGLRDASSACVKAWQEWSGTWADAETTRVIKHLDTLDHMRKQEEWADPNAFTSRLARDSRGWWRSIRRPAHGAATDREAKRSKRAHAIMATRALALG
jgi:hypothetical protein